MALALRAEGGLRVATGPDLQAFAMRGRRPWGHDPSLDLRIVRRAPPRPGGAVPLFETPVWRLDASRSSFSFEMPYASGVRRRLRIDSRWRRGTLGWTGTRLPERVAYPFRTPLLEVLWMHLLPSHAGLLVHAAAVEHCGKALLFVGRSGAGKSTLARLWRRAFPDARALSDDRTILRRSSRGEWEAHGTPWGGRAGIASPAHLPLGGIFLLRKGRRPALRDLTGAEALAGLLPCLFVPFGVRPLLCKSLDLLGRLVREALSREFTFPRDVAAARWLYARATARGPILSTRGKLARASSLSIRPGAKRWQKTHGPGVPDSVT